MEDDKVDDPQPWHLVGFGMRQRAIPATSGTSVSPGFSATNGCMGCTSCQGVITGDNQRRSL